MNEHTFAKTWWLLAILAATVLSLGLLLLTNLWVPPASADPGTLFVKPDGTGTECSQANPCALQTALAQAADGDTIYLAGGTYTGTGAAVITITQSITLYGGWDGVGSGPVVRDPDVYTTTIDGENLRRVVYISGTVSPVLDGLVIANGNAAGLGGYIGSDAGGGIYVKEAEALINNCTIISNTSPGGTGGGLFIWGSDARVENSLVMSNTARWGGGARAISRSPVFRYNRFVSNTADFGGGLYLMWTTGALVEGNLFRGNGNGNGGAIYLSAAETTIRGNRIENNRGNDGGGIGISSGSKPIYISGNRLWGNTASSGGGISIEANRSTQVVNNFIAHNEATSTGAGVYLKNAASTLIHNTVVQNSGGDGTGVFLDAGAEAVLTNTILVSHTVGISVTAGSTATLEGTLWGSGAWANGIDWGGDGTIFTGTVNVWGDPDFVDPANDDYHIGPNSAARDAGVDAGVTTDIDGDPRPIGTGYDIGADEWVIHIHLPLVIRNQ